MTKFFISPNLQINIPMALMLATLLKDLMKVSLVNIVSLIYYHTCTLIYTNHVLTFSGGESDLFAAAEEVSPCKNCVTVLLF